MPSKKEIRSRQRKKIIPSIFAPNVPPSVLKANLQFIAEDEESNRVLLFDKNYEVKFFKFDNHFLPTIQFIRDNPTVDFPSVKVDQGAVAHILNGANIFAQGITSVSRDFDTHTIVMVFNPQDAVLALGKSLKSSSEIINSKGKALENIHFLGDSIWDGKIGK
ncbi:MAG: hypothetical protein JSV04_00065 [Candidatus Heimdallarchaeota archaeon]|nr:MAG: hypothetical protein JSV04_00065 [Candidatus Heimdallarchaeota archaeon]